MLWWGWSLVVRGQKEEGLRDSVTALLPSCNRIFRYFGRAGWTACQGLRESRTGRDGLTILDEALGVVHRTGERHGEADLYRLKGELLLAFPTEHQTEAEACFRQAIAITRSQSTKSWELRAVLSLSRLYHQQGKKEEAHRMLAEIYGWFTEGFDTADLQEAKALLQVLS